MRAVLLGQPELDFVRPDGLTRQTVCIPSGLLPTPRCPRTRLEWFIAGTAPNAADDIYQAFQLDRETGLLADDSTPPEQRVWETFAVYPQEARAWAIRQGIPQPPQSAADAIRVGEDAQMRLLTPDPYTIYELSPMLPDDAQRIRLSAGVPPGTERVRYELNGVLVGESDAAPWSVWWTLALGEHELIAYALTTDGGRIASAPIRFTVVADVPPSAYTEGESE
jgi:hypothetical protein